ncbi:hypothetical protein [Micromonospora sp. U21]|uniref:hypothetical protein n=1 Tax=Micromonospora sp. U21 TaxID=2824899 RepID=UPI001B36D929|nr:hypothetical protein [Micromonospora sp. U21]MBQ0905661.1 hypothetical protein [Micromonospora sp. U21]
MASTADTPDVQRWPQRRLIVIRRDDELSAYDLERLLGGDDTPIARFPAPWPRRAGGVDAVSPTLDLAVFSGQHALHAVDQTGALRWRLRHACWVPHCLSLHNSYEEYAGTGEHRYPDRGSCSISADGSTVWAHVRTPLPDDDEPEYDEEWLVIDAIDGRILGRASTGTAAAGSHHVPHPDPGQMGISIGEGQDGVPLRWGRWDGVRLTVTSIGDDDRSLIDVSPSGQLLLTVAHHQGDLAIHRLPDGAVLHEVAADQLQPHSQQPSDTAEEPYWDYQCGFVDERTVIARADENDEEYGRPQHWLIDVARGDVLGRVEYPMPISESPMALGDGTWLTCGEDPFQLLLWSLPPVDRVSSTATNHSAVLE